MSKPEHNRTIDYIEFGATDIEATKRFYAACFGWKFTDYGPDYVAFEDGRLTGGFTTESKVGGAPLVVLYASKLEEIFAAVKRSVAASCARSSASPAAGVFTSSIRTATSWQYGANSRHCLERSSSCGAPIDSSRSSNTCAVAA